MQLLELINYERQRLNGETCVKLKYDKLCRKIKSVFPDMKFYTEHIKLAGRPKKHCYLTKEQGRVVFDSYFNKLRYPHSYLEDIVINTIEQVLNKNLTRQYKIVGTKYRIDAYDSENNIAYEVDEADHIYSEKYDSLRQQEIYEILECEFVRIKIPKHYK